jgi:hypothetical protein
MVVHLFTHSVVLEMVMVILEVQVAAEVQVLLVVPFLLAAVQVIHHL